MHNAQCTMHKGFVHCARASPYRITTRTCAGSTLTTPTRSGEVTRTGSSYCPGRSPPTSMDASNAAASNRIASRGPRTCTVTLDGSSRAGVPFWTLTATPPTAHSTGAGRIGTVTRADSVVRTRTDGSATPIVTTSVTVLDAPATDTGSVIASVSAVIAPSGPTTSTVGGSAVTVPTSKPAAGIPSTPGTTGSIFVAE